MSGSDLQYASLLSNQPKDQLNYGVKPTIFDIMAQENMHSLFQQSFKYIFNWLLDLLNPTNRRIRKYSDEIYLLTHSLIEYGYLKTYDSLFSEYFYGMKRVNLGRGTSKRTLSILLSLVVPYLKSKTDAYYEELEKFRQDEQQNSKLKKFLVKFYPYFHLFYSSVFLFYKLKFIINKSDFHSPLLHILSLRLVYNMSPRDTFSKSASFSQNPVYSILKYLNYGFTSFLFLLQFLKWHEQYVDAESYDSKDSLSLVSFYKLVKKKMRSAATHDESEEDQDDYYQDQDGLIEPPQLPDKLLNTNYYKLLMRDKKLCPLCMSKRKNECALNVSGFVFCYSCIFKFVKQHNRCPITNYPCTSKNIIRIYASQSD